MFCRVLLIDIEGSIDGWGYKLVDRIGETIVLRARKAEKRNDIEEGGDSDRQCRWPLMEILVPDLCGFDDKMLDLKI